MKRLAITAIMAVMVVLTFATPVLAYLSAPDGTMTIPSVRAFQNTVEDGDVAIIFEHNIPYSSYPTTPAPLSIVFECYSPDGTTLLNTAIPYNFTLFETKGYGHGVGVFYFPASENLSWGEAYILNIQQLPLYYNPAESTSYTLASSDYSSATLQSDSQYDVANYILGICDEFQAYYPDVGLKSTTDTAIVLSAYGEAYFRGAIPGLQTICPQLFLVQTYVPELMTTENYTMELGEEYSERLIGTDIERGAERLGDYFGVGGYFVLAMFTFGLALVPPIWTSRKGWGIEPGFAVAIVIVICAALLIGDAVFTIVMIISLIAAMAIMYIFVLKRA